MASATATLSLGPNASSPPPGKSGQGPSGPSTAAALGGPSSSSASAQTPSGQGKTSASNYASTVATQTDVVKYRGKYKELKTKVRDIEAVSVCEVELPGANPISRADMEGPLAAVAYSLHRQENEQIHLRTLNLKRTIQRMRLERA